ncbi:hypothetical protein D3C73_1300370 [compost metagenome]
MTHEEPLAFAPVDQQVLGQEHRHDHAQAVVHPAGFQQLANRRVDDRQAGACLLPGQQLLGRLAPGQGFGFRAEGAVPRDAGVTHQDVFVELAPQQFVDPGDRADLAAFELALIALQGRMQALARGNDTRSEVSRELAGAGFGREVTLALVVVDLLIGE